MSWGGPARIVESSHCHREGWTKCCLLSDLPGICSRGFAPSFPSKCSITSFFSPAHVQEFPCDTVCLPLFSYSIPVLFDQVFAAVELWMLWVKGLAGRRLYFSQFFIYLFFWTNYAAYFLLCAVVFQFPPAQVFSDVSKSSCLQLIQLVY